MILGPPLKIHILLRSAAKGAYRLALSHQLSALIDMDIIKEELPYGENEKKSKKSLYKIADPFFRFWFRVVAPNRSFLLSSVKRQRTAIFNKFASSLYCLSFEELCRQYASRLAPSIAQCKDVLFEPAGRFWQGNCPEWDVVAVSMDKKHIFLGEVKWKEKMTTMQDLRQYCQSLIIKGIPPLNNVDSMTVHFAVFVPEKPSGQKRAEFGCGVFDIGDIIKCAGMK